MEDVEGRINIFPEVLEEIISHIVNSQDGITLYFKRGIKCEIKKNRITINIMVKVKFGVRIPDLMWNLQKSIKEELEKLTNFTVRGVNIHVQEFEFPENVA